MNIPLIYRTVRHLKSTQILFQVRKRLTHPQLKIVNAPVVKHESIHTEWIPKSVCWNGDEFVFLNIQASFTGWNDNRYGALWNYNLNYMDWLNQPELTVEEGLRWIDGYIDYISAIGMGLDPYPIALRSINWIKFFLAHPEAADSRRNDYLYSQLKLLEKKLEYHLLGNHLLEDAYSLYIGSVYFNDEALLKKSQKLLYTQLEEQILSDGAHFEQSPMYHCILLDRLLDCINFRRTDFLCVKAKLMLGHLENMVWSDKTIPLFNDAAFGIAPTPAQLFDYAKRLGLSWSPVQLGASGYRYLNNNEMEAFVDIGDMTASYQPGHSQADTFSYELRIGGMPMVVDTGISTYNKTNRRQYERSTMAHNAVSVGGMDSSEVWGGFRVGRRAKVTVQTDRKNHVVATHNGFGVMKHTREVFIENNTFSVSDKLDKKVDAVNLIHLAPGIQIKENNGRTIFTNKFRIILDDNHAIEEEVVDVSTEYNKFSKSILLKINFNGQMNYKIQI